MALSVPESFFIALFCEAIMHGLYTVIFAGAMYTLTRQAARRTRTRTQKYLIALTVLMYCISTAHVALALRQVLFGIFEEKAASGGLTRAFNDPSNPLIVSQTSLELLNCLMGDSIVTWRVWVLWGGGWGILVVPGILLLAGAGTGSMLVYAYATSPISYVMFGAATTTWIEAFGSVTFAINLYGICVIGYKAWQHERAMKSIFTSGGKTHRAILVVIESGAIYCVTLLIIVFLIAANNDAGVLVVVDMLAHLTGIYPSVILVLVSLQMSYTDTMLKDRHAATSISSGDRSTNRRQGASNATYPMAPVVHVKIEGDSYNSHPSDLTSTVHDGFDRKSEGRSMV